MGTCTYDPDTGAFTTPDTYRVASPSTDLSVGTDPLTANTYVYVNGNPLNMVDEDGHRPACNGEECKFDVDAKGHFTNIKAASPAPWVPPEGYIGPLAPVAEFQNKDAFVDILRQGMREGGGWEESLANSYETWLAGATPDTEGYDHVEAAYCAGVGYAAERCSGQSVSEFLVSVVTDPVKRAKGCAIDHDGSDCAWLAVDAAAVAVLFLKFSKLGGRATVASRATANTGRVFTSADPHVADAANAVEAALPGRVAGVNGQRTMANGLTREVDIDLGNLLVQVKSGNARGLTGEIGRTQSSTGVPTIGYAPGISDAAWRNAASQGVPILRSPGELLAYVREFG